MKDEHYYMMMATKHHNAKNFAKAEIGYDKALEINKDCWPALGNRAEIYMRTGRYADAIRDLQLALAGMPEVAGGWINLGNCLHYRGYYGNALECMENALKLQPRNPLAWHGKANVLREMGGPNNDFLARQCCDKSIELDPQLAEAKGTRALLRLREGDWSEEAWADYEHRSKIEDFMQITLPKPRWNGDLKVKNLVLTTEQGLGDALMMARFAPWLAQHGINVSVLSWPKLIALFTQSFGDHVPIITPDPKKLPEDYEWCSLMSVPAKLKMSPEAIPMNIPYLQAGIDKVVDWGAKIGMEGYPKIGIVWQPGHPKLHGFGHRDIPLEAFKPLSLIPGAKLYSLQKGPGAVEIASQQASFPVIDLPGRDPNLKEAFFLDTAACMVNMDFIVSTDTSTVHLAGALGCRTFLPSPDGNCWRWLLTREDTVWYPTMTIIRQSVSKKWDGVFETIAERIKRECR